MPSAHPPHRRAVCRGGRAARRGRDAHAPRPHAAQHGGRPRVRGAPARRVGVRPAVPRRRRASHRRPNQQSIRPDQDVIGHGIERLTAGARVGERGASAPEREQAARRAARPSSSLRCARTSKARSKRSASGSATGRRATSARTSTSSGRRATDRTVPRKYEPAPNERLLVDHAEYPAEFERLVRASVEGSDAKYQDAILSVMARSARGPAAGEGRARADADVVEPDREHPQLEGERHGRPGDVRIARRRRTSGWRPNPRSTSSARACGCVARGCRSRRTSARICCSFFDRDERDTRRLRASAGIAIANSSRRRSGRASRSSSSIPALLRAVHGKAINEDTSLVISSIPFREGTEMYAVTKGVLGQLGFWDDATSESWFRDAKVDGIEVFAMSGFPYQPIVMDSVMEPIARGWLGQSSTQDSRQAFWQFKRARLLGEAIPADPRVIASMVRGWYVAKTLDRLKVEHEQRRARAEAFGVGCRHPAGCADFPHPLLSARNAQPARLPGGRDAVADDRDRALPGRWDSGAARRVQGARRARWRVGRRLARARPSGCSAATSTRARRSRSPIAPGTAAGHARRSAAGRARATSRTSSRDSGETSSTRTTTVSVYDYPVSWELREYIVEALEGLMSTVMATRSDDSGV